MPKTTVMVQFVVTHEQGYGPEALNLVKDACDFAAEGAPVENYHATDVAVLSLQVVK